VERTLTGAETPRYQLTLHTGECAAIQVEQRGFDVAVQLLAADNGLVAEADDVIGKQGAKKLDIVADHNGVYTIQVKPKLKLASGSYAIRVVEVRPATSLDRTIYEVRQLKTRVSRLLDANQPLKALPLAERALALAQQTLGPDDAYVALLTWDLAEVTYSSGKPAEARPELERALQVLAAKLGPEHPQAILVKTRLGSVCVALGELSKADQLLNQALESAEKTLGEDDPIVAAILKSLAILHGERHDLAKAEREDLQALAILERSGLTEQGIYGDLLNNVGLVYKDMREFDKAQTYFERDLRFVEQHYGTSPALSKILSNLGIVARQTKDYAAAEKYYLRALDLKEKFVGPQHPEYAAVLMNLANVYASEGDYRKALDTHLRALKIFEIDLAPGEFPPIFSLANVAKDYAALGDFANANRVQSRLEAAVEEDIALNLALGSERQKLVYLDYAAQRTERAISLNLQLEPGDSQAAATAATSLLQRKGRVLDATTDTLAALRKHSAPEDQVLLDQLKEASTQFARVALGGPQNQQSAEEYRKSLHDLQEKKETLENVISHHNEQFRAQSQPVTLAAVLSAIPDDSALLEYVTYRPFNPKAQTDAEQFGNLHYGAYVLRRDAAPRGVDLGDAKTIDALVEKFRAALRDPARNDAPRLARVLADRVFQPVQSLVAEGKRLLISPDGQLDLIPFETLRDAQGRYLVERFSVTYLSTGRDLLRMQVPRSSRSAPVIVADPFFGEPEGTLVANALPPQAKLASARTARRSITTGTDFSSLYFAQLSGTKAEAQNISALFPEARLLTGKQASEDALEHLNAPKILHIATHGFFLQDAGPQSGSPASRSGDGGRVTVGLENPLLRSGLALSGANLVKNGKGEGILTALEASNLDLWGTKLVTLSACDTGVGEVKNGEGVYGLRRSFFLAGAETLVMSLWPVSDRVTREMMTAYYAGLKRGLGRGEALRQAELSMMKRKGRRHPFFWASFIQSGEWANLDGQR
jgi:CHAT domain-containing protein/tetratricopeptide (TPR) repeat protein